jgi:GNAT superfamily N-acetyltransferase
MTSDIQPLSAAHRVVWGKLYRQYREFYGQPPDERAEAEVWRWIEDGRLLARAALVDDEPVAIAHWSNILRPLAGGKIAYLHDLFVAPSHRRQGLAQALIFHITALAKEENCQLLRWATAADNTTARRMYDRLATINRFVLYDRPLSDAQN